MKKPLRSFVSLLLCCSMLASMTTIAAAEDTSGSDSSGTWELPVAEEQEDGLTSLEQPDKIHETYQDSGSQTATPAAPITSEELDELELQYGNPVERGEYFKTFQTAEDSYLTVFTSVPVSYLDNGVWEEIDNTLVPQQKPVQRTRSVLSAEQDDSPEVYVNKANSIQVSVPEELDEENGVSLENGADMMSLLPMEGDYSRSVVKDNAIRYSDVFEGIDVQYTVAALGVKEEIILKQQVERNQFTYSLAISDHLIPELEENTIYLYDQNSMELGGVIAAPIMYDAAGETCPVELSLEETEEGYSVTVSADSQWLAEASRSYPVIIDPSMTVPATRISATTARSGGSQKPLQAAAYSVAGYMTAADVGVPGATLDMTRIFYRLTIDFSQIPQNANITKATFQNYQYSDRSNGQNQFQLYQLNSAWTSTDIVWSKASAMTGTQMGQAVPSQVGYHQWDVTSAFQAWKDGSAANYGFMLRAATESTSVHGGAFYTSESDSMFGGQGGFTSAMTPCLMVEWDEAEQPPEQEGNLEDTTIDARPLFEIIGNNVITAGAYPYGYIPEGAVMEYTLWAEDTEEATGTAEPGTRSPDDREFVSQFDDLIIYDANLTGNWQPVEANDSLQTNVLYRYTGIASRERAPDPELGETEPVMETSPEVESCTFLLYPVSNDDIITKLANYYGVSSQQVKEDNHLPNDLMMAGDILYIRDPQRNTDLPYSFGGLTLDEEALIEQMRLGRAVHCVFGFEPINLNTGNFIMEQQDAAIPDYVGDFSILRTYNSQGAAYNGIFGRGWQFEYGEGLSLLADGTILYRRGDGSAVPFTKTGSGYEAPEGYNLTLEASSSASETDSGAAALFGTRYTVTDTTNDTVKTFNRYGLLVSIRTREGFTTSLTYDDNYNLYTITSPAGTEYEFTCDASGLVRQISLPNGGTLTYEYDDHRNLISFTNAMGDTTRYTYDENSLLLTGTDADGNTFVDNTYDEQGRVVSQLDAVGNETTLEYGDSMTTATDANGNVTIYRYDDRFYTTSVEYPDGTSESMEYDEAGNLTASVDQAGNRTTYEYDSRDNLVAIHRWDGAARTFEYNDANQIVKIIDYDGKITTYTYSTSGDLLTVTNPDGTTVSYEYNNQHQPISQTDANGNVTRYEYEGAWLSAIVDAEGNRTEFYYNAMGLPTSMVDANGAVARIGYDLAGRTIMEQSADGAATYYEFSPGGYVLSITDPNGHLTTFDYDPNGNIVKGTDPLGGTLTMTYDAVWNILSETDARGITTSYTYDSMNRLSSVTDGDGNTVTYTYDALGNLASITDAKGGVTTYSYDLRFNLPVSATDALGNVTALEYDEVGNALKQTNADGSVLLYEYDSMNRVSKTTDAAGLETVSSYDANGNLVAMEDNAGRTLSYAYNALNLPVELTLPNGGKLVYEYDALGNLISQTDAMGNKTTYTYDEVGRVLSMTDALGNTTSYSYDANGNLLSLVDALGGETSYQYDALDRLRIAEDALDNQTVAEYDGSDNISVVRNALGAEWQYQYNGRDLPSAVTDPMGSVYTLSYDGNGNNTQLKTPDGGVAIYEYDALNRLVKSTDAQGLVTEYEYDSMSRLVKEWDNAGNEFTYLYDDAGRLAEMRDALDQPTKYEYDIAGNITAITTYDGNRTVYTYDTMGNVLTATDAEEKTVTYEYDLNNNLLGQEDHLHRQWKYAYDAVNRLVRDENPAEAANQYEYDALGNVTKITNAAGYSQLYAYDSLGNLLSFTDENENITSYEYDALSRVIRSTAADGGETEYQYDALDRPITVRDALGNITSYGYDVMSNQTSVTRPEGGVYQYTYNFHGAATSMTDPLGNVTEYTVDLNDRLTHKLLPTGAEYSYEYDLIGRLTKLTQPEGMWDAFTYDARGDLVTQTDEGDRETAYTYDIMHRLLTATNAEGHTTSYAYNDAGVLSELTTALGYTTAYEYDVLDQVVSVTDPVGMVTKFEYDILGNPVKTTVNDQHPTSYSYDPVGNLISVTNALDQIVSYEYDAMNRQVKDVSTAGKIQSYGYDLNGQLISTTNRLGGVADYAYDGNGNLISYSDEEDYSIQYSYDLADRLIQAQEGDTVTSYTYDAVGNLISATNGEGHTTQYGYDLADRMVSITNPLDQIQQFQYDVSGRLSQTTNPDGSSLSYDYDKLDQLVNKEASDREDDQALYGYDADGRMVTMEDVTGSNSYEYDGVNRITAVNLFNGQQIRYEYDEFGNLARLIYPDGTENSYTYDALNRMTSATDRRGETTEYTYDLAGNVVRIDRPNNTYTTIEYNDMDQVTKLVNYSKGKILSSFQYEYDLSGFIVKEIASQDKEETVTSTYAYDYRCQLVRVRMTTESGPVIEREYAYDKAGNRIMEETTSDGVVIRRVESEYDDASRLISQNIWEDSAPGHSGDKPEKPEKIHTDNGHHYGNDKGDNHIDKKGQQQAEAISSNADDQEAIANNTAELLPPDVYDSGVEAWSGKHDPDQTISYQYDENGNLTEKSGSDIDTFSYQYDNENRLRAVMQNGTVLMAALYDGNGDRIFKLQRHSTSGNVPSSEEKKNNGNNKNKDKDKNNGNQGSSTNGDVPVDLALLEDVMLLPTGANKTNIESFDLTGYINDVNRQYTQVLMEYGKNGKYNSIYSYGLQRLGADYSGAQTVYLYDGRGSMVNETNGSGTSMSAYLYDEWGNLLSGKVHTNGFYSDLYLYNGEATDITTGLQYLRARYYDPGMGRFVQEDTFLGYVQTPLSLNLYIYVQNNPLNYIDPSGNVSTSISQFQFNSISYYFQSLLKEQNRKYNEYLEEPSEYKKGKLWEQYNQIKQYTVSLCTYLNTGIASDILGAKGTLNSNSFLNIFFDQFVDELLNDFVDGLSNDYVDKWLSRGVSLGYSLVALHNYLINSSINVEEECKEAYNKDGYILSQQEFVRMRIGLSNMKDSGCGVISIYNAMLALDMHTELIDIISFMDADRNRVIAGALLGVAPWAIMDYFLSKNILPIASMSEDQIISNSKFADANIILYLRDPITKGAHYVMYDSYNMNTEEYKYYEDKPNRDNDFRTLQEFLQTPHIAVFGISLYKP